MKDTVPFYPLRPYNNRTGIVPHVVEIFIDLYPPPREKKKREGEMKREGGRKRGLRGGGREREESREEEGGRKKKKRGGRKEERKDRFYGTVHNTQYMCLNIWGGGEGKRKGRVQ